MFQECASPRSERQRSTDNLIAHALCMPSLTLDKLNDHCSIENIVCSSRATRWIFPQRKAQLRISLIDAAADMCGG